MSDLKEKARNIIFMKEVSSDMNSETICSAKWLQSTINLYNGTTHSCHHCPRHSIDVEELKINPLAIHNTEQKREERIKMLNNERPKECNYCWTSEDSTGYSDRFVKTGNEHWSIPHVESLQEDNPYPTYVELGLDYTCNMRCLYCSPAVSSRWFDEIVKHGDFNDMNKYHSLTNVFIGKEVPIRNRDYNPFREAFDTIWPELHKTLKVFRITGGEPLLSRATWDYLQYIATHDSSHLGLSINSNLSTKQVLVRKLIDYLKENEHKLNRVEVVTSCEAYGKQAEYIRDGLDYDKFIKNCWLVLEETERTTLTITMTNNVLSILSLDKFLLDVYEMRKKFGKRVYLSFTILRSPNFMDMRLLGPVSARVILNRSKRIVDEHGDEIDKTLFSRLLAYMDVPITNPSTNSKDLFRFLEEWDSRRGSNYKEIFPGLDELVV